MVHGNTRCTAVQTAAQRPAHMLARPLTHQPQASPGLKTTMPCILSTPSTPAHAFPWRPVLLHHQAYLEKAVKINDYDDSVMKVGTFSGIW